MPASLELTNTDHSLFHSERGILNPGSCFEHCAENGHVSPRYLGIWDEHSFMHGRVASAPRYSSLFTWCQVHSLVNRLRRGCVAPLPAVGEYAVWQICARHLCRRAFMCLTCAALSRAHSHPTAHIRQSRPDSGRGSQVKVLQPVRGVPFWLGSPPTHSSFVFWVCRGTLLTRNSAPPTTFHHKCKAA